ncbi:hypothetical protein [Pendulispora albinea]|uniref:Uncharacterized protein n=1 Tax=Pendulispora albinea TaxID=2741071 RepID=A0ABZ2LYJ2_9BACT
MPASSQFIADVLKGMPDLYKPLATENASYTPPVSSQMSTPAPAPIEMPLPTPRPPPRPGAAGSLGGPGADLQLPWNLESPGPPHDAGGMSVQPPALSTPNMSYASQAPTPPPTVPGSGAPPPPGVVMMRGGTTPAREVPTMGETQLKLLNKAQQERAHGLEVASEFEKKAATQQAMAATVRQDEAEAQMRAATQARALEQQRLDAANDDMRKASTDIAATKDTDFWADNSVGGKIGMALALGLGQLGASLTKGQNSAMQILQSQIDSDIKTKQMNFQRKLALRDSAQQRFNNLANQIGLDSAKDVYAAAARERVASRADQIAASLKIPEIDANAAKLKASMSADADEFRAKAALKYVAAQKTAPQYMIPGNPVPVSGPTAFAALEKRGEQASEQQNRLDVASMKDGARTDEGTKLIAQEYQRAKIPERLAALDAAAQSMVPSAQNPDAQAGIGITGRTVRGALGDLGYTTVYGSEAGKREQNWDKVKAGIRNAITGAGMSDEERERLDAMLDGAGTPEARANTIAVMRSELQAQANAIHAGAGPEATERFLSNLQRVTPSKIQTTPVKR